jgi:hypothetical protein
MSKDLAKSKQQTERSTFGEHGKGDQRESVDAERSVNGSDP